MIENKPLISIIIPIFNRVLYLPQAIESVSKQKYKNIEIIIVDDSSTEDILSTVKECQDKYTFKTPYLKKKK
jgi:glycosyltransferase involved in cell wall biosynthesis